MPKFLSLKNLDKRKKIIIAIALIIILILTIFGAKILLYANFILGNDVIIKLNADKETLSLLHNQKENITFETKVTTNPFCKAICYSEFKDISRDIIIEKDEFTLSPGIPAKKEYSIEATQLGSGQELYRFSMDCQGVRTFLCHTGEEITTRSILITVDYGLNNEERLLKEELKSNLTSSVLKTNEVYSKYLSCSKVLNQLNKTVDLDDNLKELESIDKNFSLICKNLQQSHQLWVNLEYNKLSEKNKEIESSLKLNNIESLQNSTDLILLAYNNIINELFLKRDIILEYKKNITSVEYAKTLNLSINAFNNAVITSESRNSLREKEKSIKGLESQIALINTSFSNETFNESTPIADLLDLKLNKVTLEKDNNSYIAIEFEEPQPQCCIFGKCQVCCITSECKNNPSTYPAIFIHGHAVNKDSSAEYSLEGFNQIQEKLEESGYINAGTITLFTAKDAKQGDLALIPAPLTIRASYYFDIFQEPENYIAVQTKSENIDTYAIRLKDVVEAVKYRTEKPKVNIVAFSMGGLVTRRYLQIFNEDSVNKVILIGTPNKGIVGNVANYCSLTGEELECRDMNENSLFMNKLNRDSLPQIPVYNIVGTGCEMNGKQGDGIVLEEKATLEGTQNYIIEGKCRSLVSPLHLDLRNIEMYPEVYEIIRKALK